MVKTVTKSIHERLDNFVFNDQKNTGQSSSNEDFNSQYISKKRKTIKKKSDGLIEKTNSEIFLEDDNRQLLNE